MGLEIERKFLVQGESWKSLGTPVLFHQGYLNRNPERSVRVRIEGDIAKLNIKALMLSLAISPSIRTRTDRSGFRFKYP